MILENEFEIVNKLINLRKAKNISTYKLSELSGLNQSKISKIENFNQKLSVCELISFLKGLGITLEEFFAEEKKDETDKNDLILKFNQLTIKNKKNIINLIDTYLKEKIINLPKNILFTGVSGVGKSYNLKEILKILLCNFKKAPKIYLFNPSSFDGDWVYKEYKNLLDNIFENICEYSLEYIDIPNINSENNNDILFEKLSEIQNCNELSILIMDNFDIKIKNSKEEELFQKIFKKEGIYCYIASQSKNIFNEKTFELVEQYNLIQRSNQINFMNLFNMDIKEITSDPEKFMIFNMYLDKLKAKGLIDENGITCKRAEDILINALEADIKLSFLPTK